jgi:copper transport protein
VRARRACPLLALLLGAMLTHASSALAHAQLLDSSPQAGSTLSAQPAQVIFEFNQAVGGTLGAVRVYDAQGNEVDDLDVTHPRGHQRWMGVGLKSNLPDGTYTATYRVISADTHVVYGGLVFNIGHAGATPRFTVARLIERNHSGPITAVALGMARGLDYLALALWIGGLAFLLCAWLPGLRASARGVVIGVVAEGGWEAASRAFARRLRLLLTVAVSLGVLASALGILLQGASAAGVSLWASVNGTILSDTLTDRFGEVWGLRGIVWVLLGALLIASRVCAREAILVRGSATPDGGAIAISPHTRRALIAAGGVSAALLAITPALSGHASVQSPTGVFVTADALHVLAASVWVGGIACLLFALPAATRGLEGPQRSRLLLAVLLRFSPLALACVAAIAATGVVQAYIDVRSLDGLLHTTYGALLIVKAVLLTTLIGLGWVNRERLLPALRRIARAGNSPGATGVAARRTMRGELALMLVVFAVTAALVGYTPPIDATSGPFSRTATLGPAELEMTVDPARVGLNTVHLYLIEPATGTQFTHTKELTVTARLPSKGIGPLPLHSNLAGPGHYVLNSAQLSPGGTWDLQITDRVSEFDEYSTTIAVPIR